MHSALPLRVVWNSVAPFVIVQNVPGLSKLQGELPSEGPDLCCTYTARGNRYGYSVVRAFRHLLQSPLGWMVTLYAPGGAATADERARRAQTMVASMLVVKGYRSCERKWV